MAAAGNACFLLRWYATNEMDTHNTTATTSRMGEAEVWDWSCSSLDVRVFKAGAVLAPCDASTPADAGFRLTVGGVKTREEAGRLTEGSPRACVYSLIYLSRSGLLC